MKLWRIMAIVLVCLFVTTVAVAGTFEWAGTTSTADWEGAGSWTCKGFCLCGLGTCYPRTKYDDAVIEEKLAQFPQIIVGTIVINDDYTIDDLTIISDADLEGGGDDPTLDVDSLVLQGPMELTVTDMMIYRATD